MKPTLNIQEPTPKPFSYSQEVFGDTDNYARVEFKRDQMAEEGENMVVRDNDDEIVFAQDDFIDDQDGKCNPLGSLFSRNIDSRFGNHDDKQYWRSEV